MIDFILDYKKKEAEDKGIDFIINADAVYTNKIRNEDICIILANLLDNAIEAAREHKGPKRWIHVTIRKIGDLLLFKIQNSIGHVPDRKGKFLRSTKENVGLHGIGLKNVRETVEKYYGEMCIRDRSMALQLMSISRLEKSPCLSTEIVLPSFAVISKKKCRICPFTAPSLKEIVYPLSWHWS